MTSRVFDAVLFDMDGVLCDSEPLVAASAIEMLRRRYGVTATRDDFSPYVGAGEDRYIAGGAARHGIIADLARDKAAMYEIYLELIRAGLEPIAGAREFIAEIRGAGLRLALATSSDRPKLDGNLAAIRIPEETFDALVSGEQVVNKKPDPEIFLRAVAALGLPAARCLVVEDARNGVIAGRAAGCAVLGIASSHPASVLLAAGAMAVAPDFPALPAEVRRALGLGWPRMDARGGGPSPVTRPAGGPSHEGDRGP
jgi:beta-phosphoglucomutase